MDIFSDIEKKENLHNILNDRLSDVEIETLKEKSEERLGVDDIFGILDEKIKDIPNDVISEDSLDTTKENINDKKESKKQAQTEKYKKESKTFIDVGNNFLVEEKLETGSYEKSKEQKSLEKTVESLVKKYNANSPMKFFGGGGGLDTKSVNDLIDVKVSNGELSTSGTTVDIVNTVISEGNYVTSGETVTIVNNIIDDGNYTTSGTTVDIINNYLSDGTLYSGRNVINVSADYVSSVYDVVLVDNNTNVTISIPSASASTNKALNIKKISNNGSLITISASDGNIDNDDTAIISSVNTAIELISDGISWWII